MNSGQGPAVGDPSGTRRAALLEAHGLAKRYRSGSRTLEVLRGVDLTVGRGEFVAVLGRSGSGKSTLLHLLGGLDRPAEGEVRYDGQAVVRAGRRGSNAYRRGTVGMVFQAYHLLPELTAVENVTIAAMLGGGPAGWLRRRGSSRSRAEALLAKVGLADRASHRPSKLSGGERQRVAIARALMNEPAVLLADEPTGNLDAETGAEVMAVIEALHAGGQTIVMVTHDDAIADRADRQVVLERGKVTGGGGQKNEGRRTGDEGLRV
jgi:ABC-type lipoprotein export system ATPase subunit